MNFSDVQTFCVTQLGYFCFVKSLELGLYLENGALAVSAGRDDEHVGGVLDGSDSPGKWTKYALNTFGE